MLLPCKVVRDWYVPGIVPCAISVAGDCSEWCTNGSDWKYLEVAVGDNFARQLVTRLSFAHVPPSHRMVRSRPAVLWLVPVDTSTLT